MGSVRTLASRGTLFLDFRYRGQRCREYTALTDSPANRKRLQKVMDKIEAEIASGTFDYQATFPGSRVPPELAAQGPAIAAQTVQTAQPVSVAPLPASGPVLPTFRDFTTTWIAEHQIEWRRSHVKVLVSTLQGHLLPAFGDRPVGSISKADVLAFRNELASKPGRTGEKLGNKRINNVLGVLRRAMADAAERYGFTSPCTNIRPLKVRKSDVQPFSLDQVQFILATVRPDWRDYFTLRFLTGLRTGEAHGLKWKYVDFERRLILIRETFVLGEPGGGEVAEGGSRILAGRRLCGGFAGPCDRLARPCRHCLRREALGQLAAWEELPVDERPRPDPLAQPLDDRLSAAPVLRCVPQSSLLAAAHSPVGEVDDELSRLLADGDLSHGAQLRWPWAGRSGH